MDKPLKIKRRKVSLDSRKARAGYFFVAPFVLGIILVYLPILFDSILTSFFTVDYSNIDPVNVFVGFDHYSQAIFGSTGFVDSLWAGLQQMILEVPTIIIFSLFIAVVLNQKMLGRAVFRAIFFVPVIISTGLMVTINTQDIASDSMAGGADDGSGSGMLDINFVEDLFRNMAIGGDMVEVVVGLVNQIFDIINYSGVQMLIFLAGLQSISESIYEACRIDGATGWETFWKVTFPMISPMILVNAVYTVIDSFTRSDNKTMHFISVTSGALDEGVKAAMYWVYFLVVILIIAAVAGIVSTFIFYQKKD